MNNMINLLFGLLLSIGYVSSDSLHNKVVNEGKGAQYANNPGALNYHGAPFNNQPPNSKYELRLTYMPTSNYRNAHIDAVPYPGVYSFPTKAGPLQYAISSQQQPFVYQQPNQIASHQPTPAYSNVAAHSRTHHGSTILVPQTKYAPAHYNAIVPLNGQSPYYSQPHHFHLQPQPSAFIPISVPVQHHQPNSVVTHASGAYPAGPQQAHVTPLSTPIQHEERPNTHVAPAQLSGSTSQYVAGPHAQQQHQTFQQPQYTYSIQPSLQISPAKQIAAPIQSTQQYKQDNYETGQHPNDAGLPSSYVSLIRQYTLAPSGKPTASQQPLYANPASPHYATVKPYAQVQPTGQGTLFDYTNAGAATLQYSTQLYHHPSNDKASSLSEVKYT